MSCDQDSSFESNNEESMHNGMQSIMESQSSELEFLSKEPTSYSSSTITGSLNPKGLLDTNATNTRNGCSETISNPIVWQKFQFLISVLKDIQFNIQEIDTLILNHEKDADKKNDASKIVSLEFSMENNALDPLTSVCESSKTDEAKLNEILGLLHRITSTLSNFEQSPLMADEIEGGNGPGLKREALTSADPEETLSAAGKVEKGIEAEHERRVRVVSAWTQTELCGSYDTSSERCFSTEEESRLEAFPSHRFATETTSLRNDIENAMRRKRVLDHRLQMLKVQRQQRCKEEQEEEKEKDEKEEEEEEGNGRQSFPEYEIEGRRNADSSLLNGDAGNSGEFRKREEERREREVQVSEIVENDAIILELRNDEEQIPGLAESGLSTEINTLSITIKEIMRENQELHAVFQTFSPTEQKEESQPRKKKKKRKKKKEEEEDSEVRESARSSSTHSDQSDSSHVLLSDRALKASFERKIKSLLREQTDLVLQLRWDRQAHEEKGLRLERMVAEAVRVNRENRLRYSEELHALDVENCRLEDRVQELQRQSSKLKRENETLRKGVEASEPASVPAESEGTSAVPCTAGHETCLGHILRLASEKEAAVRELQRCRDRRPAKHRRDPRPRSNETSASENDSSNRDGSDGRQFCSLPLPSKSTRGHADHATQRPEATNPVGLVSELNALKRKVSQMEAGFGDTLPSSLACQAQKSDITMPDRGRQVNREEVNVQQSTCHIDRGSESPSVAHRIEELLREKEGVARRMEEQTQVLRELAFHFRVAKEELAKAKKDRTFLLDKLKTRSELSRIDESIVNGEASLKVMELNQKMQDKCHQLQLEVERAWGEAHRNALERDRMAEEKGRMNLLLTSSLAHIQEENVKLQSSLRRQKEESKTQVESTVSSVRLDDVKEVEREEEERKKEEGGNMEKELVEEDGKVQVEVEEEEIEEEEVVGEDSRRKEDEVNANWQQSLLWLQRCFVEERLHGELLEAAERENATRLQVLQEMLKKRGARNSSLALKYKKLLSLFLLKKETKKTRRRALRECSMRFHEFHSTTSAIEENYRVMLSCLGKNIGLAVEVLSAHLYFRPAPVHPCPELSVDPAFWFAAQCSRLRWLQAQLRKVCLRSWKGHDVTSSRGGRREGEEKGVQDEKEGEEEEEEEEPSPPSSLLSSLSEVEMTLTRQQVELARSKRTQYNRIVDLLGQDSHSDVSSLSLSPLTSSSNPLPENPLSNTNQIHSTDISLSESLSSSDSQKSHLNKDR